MNSLTKMEIELQTNHNDPLKVLSSTKSLLESPQFVFINPDKIETVVDLVETRINQGFISTDEAFGTVGTLEDNAQLIFLENVVNFCFWSLKDEPKWQIKFSDGSTCGGWFGLKKSFERALSENIPILDAEYLANLKLEDIEYIFRSANEKQIPLIEARLRNFREAGKVLLDKYEGKFFNLLKATEFSAPDIAKKIYEDFSSFRDIVEFQEEKIYFLKRAQICPYDLSYLEISYPNDFKIQNIDQLTVFADYKLPQVLRSFEIISYADSLAKKIDNYIPILQESRQELEIRANTIWASELIRQKISDFNSALIDNALWFLGSELNEKQMKPYHRTESIYY